MKLTRRQALLMTAGATVAASVAMNAAPAAAQSEADEFVQVTMYDHGAEMVGNFDFSERVMLGTPGAAMKNSAPMGFTLNKYVIPHGAVKFIATNTSTFSEHEMLVLPIADVTKPLPYDTNIERIPEDQADFLGEIHEVAPGETGSVTLDLAPGTYMLVCNIANHYAMGMWTLITVI